MGSNLSRKPRKLASTPVSLGAQPNLVPQLVHELRSALAIVVHGGQLLGDEVLGTLSARQREVVGMLRDNAHKLQLLIDYLALYDRWRERGTAPEPAAFSLKPAIERCVQRYRQLGSAHGIDIGLACADLELRLDATALCLIVDGLLAHAVQFSPEGGRVTLAVAQEGGVQPSLSIEIRDQGPGVNAGQQDTIFAAANRDMLVWKGREPPQRAGLGVVRDCVLAQGGTIESLPDAAGFRVRLPLQPQDL